MKFNLTKIEAKAGEELKIVLKNIGTQPKEVLGHNWVLLKLGSDAGAFAAAAVTVTVSSSPPTSSVKSRVTVRPTSSKTPCRSSALKPSSFADTRYGPGLTWLAK